MATTFYPRTDTIHSLGGLSGYSQAVVTDLDLRDNRYPSLAATSTHRTSAMLLGTTDSPTWEAQGSAAPPTSEMQQRLLQQRSTPDGDSVSGWTAQAQPSSRPQSSQSQTPSVAQIQSLYQSQSLFRPTSPVSVGAADLQSLRSLQSQSQQSQAVTQTPSQQLRHESIVSYALPPGAARRVVERYSLDDKAERAPSRGSEGLDSIAQRQIQQGTSLIQNATSNPSASGTPPDRPSSLYPSSPRHPSLPLTGVSNTSNGRSSPNAPFPQSIMPLSASPAYSPPISPNMRAYAQQPTYINPLPPANMTTPYSPPAPLQAKLLQPLQPQQVQPVQEEVCVECAMRDQDMADVDVTSPGVWDRDSDVQYMELLQRELEEEANGGPSRGGSLEEHRPRARGGRLTEQNLRIWLTMNPREPTARQQTLMAYLKSQRTLLEAEALAHARAMKEAKQLDNHMRDAYSQLRRSAYDMGSSAAPTDDTGGVRIKPPVPIYPSSPYSPQASSPVPIVTPHGRHHSREITLLENGMIVEHVDVRKEEKEERERRRKEEKRARKSSRSSGMDVTSIYSAQSFPPSPSFPPDGGLSPNNRPYSRYSQATGSSVGRPASTLDAMSVAGSPRPDIPKAYSQASFSDAHSLGPASPKRAKFLGIRHLGGGWRSQDSLAPSGISMVSGSMVNMHVALAREEQRQWSVINLNTPTRQSHIWPPLGGNAPHAEPVVEGKPKKKGYGLAKLWQIVTGSNKHEATNNRGVSQSFERTEDDMPLAPPPPLSYLVDRTPGEVIPGSNGSVRRTSTPSLPSTTSPKMAGVPSTPGMSPSTAPSSILPSPTSSRPSGHGVLEPISDAKKLDGLEELPPAEQHTPFAPQRFVDGVIEPGMTNVQLVISEPDMRLRSAQSMATLPSMSPSLRPPLPTLPAIRPMTAYGREKSLPPLPGDPLARTSPNLNQDLRPRTVFAYDIRPLPPGAGTAVDFAPPNAAFRVPDVRRQSFGGLSSRPNLGVQTMPLNSDVYDPNLSFGPTYNEFGLSRRSLGRIDNIQPPPSFATPKRKSKFGLTSLWKKSSGEKDTSQKQSQSQSQSHQFPLMRPSTSDMHEDDLALNGYAASTSKHSVLSGISPSPGPRMSVTSRKAIEELVPQDPEFVAYRYPSNEQRLDLLR